MKHVIIFALAAHLAGCATFYKPVATARLVCPDPECTTTWAAAQTWLAKNSRYRLQMVNDSVIQTYGPHERVHDAVAYTLTREPAGGGRTMIVISGACHATVYGCVFDPAPLVNALYYDLGGK